jgi:4-amino-4-deoxy-L-arabinose transferase-like glycosyltransferase
MRNALTMNSTPSWRGVPIVWIGAAAAIVTLLRVVYLWFSPYSLAEDEAFYWEWSLRLDWSYATKGPGIAWAIWLATELGGTSAWAIRNVAAYSGGVTLLALGMLTHDVARRVGHERPVLAGLAAMGLLLAAPVFAGIGILCTIDGPYVACWALACWAAWRAMAHDRHGDGREGGVRWGWWALLGAALALGFIFKYTILLLVPGLMIGAWRLARHGALAGGWRRGATVALLLAALGLVPVVIWNSQHDWQTIKHLLGHLGVRGGDVAPRSAADGPDFPLQWVLEFAVLQAGFVLPAVVAMIAGTVWAVRRGGSAAGGVGRMPGGGALGFMLGCAWPILVFYVLVALMTEPEANWPIAGYVTIMGLAGVWITLPRRRAGGRAGEPGGVQRLAINSAIIGGVLVTLVLARADWLHAGVRAISPGVAAKIPMGRLFGGPEMAADVHARVEALRAERMARGEMAPRPMVISTHYGRASRIRFYLPGRPVTYAASRQTGGRVVQQDYWADADLGDPALVGRDAILIGGDAQGEVWRRAFERVEPAPGLAGEGKRGRPVFVGHGYRGFGTP